MFDATVDAVAEKAKAEAEAKQWTNTDEMLALNAEITYLLLSAFISANSKGRKAPPFHIDRPGGKSKPAAQVMTHEQLMQAATSEEA